MSNGHIFISYRRDDSAGYARALYNKLDQRFSKVFIDADAIEPGLPFDEAIRRAVGQCDILLAIIGKRWMEDQAGAGPRIHDPKDFVRLEIATALSRNIRVIPVLLDGAIMPSEEALPEPLRALVWRNAIEVSNSRFNSDAERLMEAVSRALGELDTSSRKQGTRIRKPKLYWLIGGIAAVAVVSSIAYKWDKVFPLSPQGEIHAPVPDGSVHSKRIQTVRVESGGAARYGFFTAKGFVVTADLGQEESAFRVIWSDEAGEKRASARLVNRVNQIALLQVVGVNVPRQYLPIGLAGSLQAGDSVERYISDNDRVKGTVKDVNAQRTIAMSHDKELSLNDLVVTTNISAGGDMGAPVLDKDGKVIGIVYGGSRTETILIPIDEVKGFFRDAL
jgi:hypothetical protein